MKNTLNAIVTRMKQTHRNPGMTMYRNLLLLLLAFAFVSCESEYEITPSFVPNYSAPPYAATQPVVKVYVNDYTSRVVYVGEEFEVKVAVYDMPPLLVATSLELNLGNTFAVLGMEYDTLGNGYFAEKESTLTVMMKYPGTTQTRVAFVKTYLNGTTPNAGAQGVLFKVRCKATAKVSGSISLAPSSVIFWRMSSPGTVGNGANPIEFTPEIQGATLQIRDEFFIP